jgi:hypothetical protein
MNTYSALVDDINQGVMAQLAVPADLLSSSTQVAGDGLSRRVEPFPIPDESDDEPRKNRFERIAEEMLMNEEP